MPPTQATLPLTSLTGLRPMIPGITRRKRRKVVVIANGKGGVGKSSLAANIAVTCTLVGKQRVLLIEMDPQGNNAEDLGFIGSSLYDRGEGQARAIFDGTGLKPTGEARSGLWVVPGGEALEELIEELYIQRRAARNTGDPTWLYMYATAIAQAEGDYDQIILDVAPGCLPMQMQAMIAGDMVMIPSRSDESSRKGLRIVSRRIGDALPYNPYLALIGIVLFGVTSGGVRTSTRGSRIAADIRELILQDVRGAAPVFDTTIRYSEKAAVECRREGLTAIELAMEKGVYDDPRNPLAGLAKDYRALVREHLTRTAALMHPEAAS